MRRTRPILTSLDPLSMCCLGVCNRSGDDLSKANRRTPMSVSFAQQEGHKNFSSYADRGYIIICYTPENLVVSCTVLWCTLFSRYYIWANLTAAHDTHCDKLIREPFWHAGPSSPACTLANHPRFAHSLQRTECIKVCYMYVDKA